MQIYKLPLIVALSLAPMFPLAVFAAENPTQIAGERHSVDLTIYNSDLALIRELRTLPLKKGLSKVIVPEIPATIDGTSLHFSSLTDASAVKILEQNYQYDLVSNEKLLEKFVGKNIEFIRIEEEKKKEYTVTGKLLAIGNGAGITAEINGKIEINPIGRLVLPSLPDGLILKPQLEWLVDNRNPVNHEVEISYLAHAMSWNCDYVVLLNAEDNKIDLKGWVTLVNNTGTTFKNAGLKLVAGDVNVIPEEPVGYSARGLAKAASYERKEEPQFQQKDLFEYKIYSLQRRTDVNNNESKQIELVAAHDATARKVLIYDGMQDGWRYWMNDNSYRSQGSFGQQSNTKVGVYVIFKNEEKAGLGLPLPKGKVRVYKKDNDGKEQFVGEDNLDHTAKGEEVKLYLGNAFDVVASRVQKDFKTIVSGHSVEETYEVKLRNHKSTATEVWVYEHPWRASQWEISKVNCPWEKVDQTTIKIPVKLEKDQEKTIIYTIRYTW